MYSIILPCYNEKENLPLLITKIKFYLRKKKFKIYIIDDHSNDGTEKIIKKKFKYDKRILFTARTKYPRSLGQSVGEGILMSKSDKIIVMDTDFNHNPKYLLTLINQHEQFNYSLICGSRFLNTKLNKLKSRYIISRIYNLIMKPLMRSKISDNLSGFFFIDRKIVNKNLFNKIFYGYGDYYIRLLHYMQKKNNFNIKEVSIVYDERKFGLSKTKFINVFLKYTFEIIKLNFRK
jgi:dolichol-phosphate mannosyltransferase